MSKRSVFLLLLFVSMIWGANVVMIKYLTNYYPPLALAPIRLTLAAALLLPLVLREHGCVLPPREAWLPIVGVATCSIFLHQIGLSLGVATTSGTHAVLILGLNPLLTTILASFLVKEALTWSKGLGVILGFGGAVLVVYGKPQQTATMTGDLWMAFSMITYVFGSLYVKKATTTVSPLLVTAYSHMLAAIALVVFGLFVNDSWYYEGAIAFWPITISLVSSLLCTALGAYWWNMGIKRVGASTTSLFLNGIPLFGVFSSALFLGEAVYWQHVVALLLVTLGVSLGTGLIRPERLLALRAEPVEDKE